MASFGPLSSTPISALPIVAAGGGDAVFAGTATIVFGQTGAFTANSVHAGTATLTFGQTGAFRGGAGFAGTDTITFGQTGAFRGGAGFAGTATLTFGQSGALLARSALAGTATLVFGQSGAFGAASALAGSATVTFGQTGTLNARSALAGTAPITFGQSGDFVAGAAAGDAVFVGTATITFGQSGTFEAGLGTASVTPPEVNWPGIQADKERQRANLVAALIDQAKERGKEWMAANKPQVRRNIRRTIERELKAQGLLTDAIMDQVRSMVADAVDSVPMLDIDALQQHLAQYDQIIWQQAERLAEEYRLARIMDDEEALILIMAAA